MNDDIVAGVIDDTNDDDDFDPDGVDSDAFLDDGTIDEVSEVDDVLNEELDDEVDEEGFFDEDE